MLQDVSTRIVLRRGDAGYDAARSGFNTAVEHHPVAVVEVASAAEVIAAVRRATAMRVPVAMMNTGHGPSRPADGALLIRLGRMNRVLVDPVRRTARVEGGATWDAVISAAAPHGLAPLNGSSPSVGVAGYVIGGGVGLLARRFGFAADHVRWIEIVTADGTLRRVSAPSDPELFWALRGAGANFGVVTAMEIDLMPVSDLVGGELVFGPAHCADVIGTYVEWAKRVPETMASSLMLMTYPAYDTVPERLRGRHVSHVRVAYSGDDRAAGHALVEPLRAIGPRLLDTVRELPYADVGTIHHDPTEPVAAYDRNTLLDDLDADAAAVLHAHAGPPAAAPFMVELRAWGGALSRQAAAPNCIGGRDAAFSLLAISGPEPQDRARRDALLDAMAPWSTGMTYPNFCGVEDVSFRAIQRAYLPADLVRLRHLKHLHDPHNVFCVNFNIPPEMSER